MPKKRTIPLSLTNLSSKKQRLYQTILLLQSHSRFNRNEMANLLAKELNIDKATAYSYLRELKETVINCLANYRDEQCKI